MKKLVLILGMLFATISVVNANKTVTINKDTAEKTLFVGYYDCWDAANDAEAEYCGYVGCNFDYWVGYFDACVANMK